MSDAPSPRASNLGLPLIGHDAFQSSAPSLLLSSHSLRRKEVRELLSSRGKHYVIVTLVALDVAGILADIFVSLLACDRNQKDAVWVHQAQESLQLAALFFSSIFLFELLVSIWAFGIELFKDWFYWVDAITIAASFVIDVVTHGIVEEIASLVIVVRLWRFVKIVEELGVAASERREEFTARGKALEREIAGLMTENRGLKAQIEELRGARWAE